jgi:hypothetical protein
MASWTNNTLRVFRSYFVVELLFGLWGLACAYLTYSFKLNWNVMLVGAVAGGFLTALLLQLYLASDWESPESTSTSNPVGSPSLISGSFWLGIGPTTPELEYALILAAAAIFIMCVSYRLTGPDIAKLVDLIDKALPPT